MACLSFGLVAPPRRGQFGWDEELAFRGTLLAGDSLAMNVIFAIVSDSRY